MRESGKDMEYRRGVDDHEANCSIASKAVNVPMGIYEYMIKCGLFVSEEEKWIIMIGPEWLIVNSST